MSAVTPADLAPLETILGHRFADAKLLLEAVTHASAHTAARAKAPNYQRLEFLGDRVLALVVAEMLIETFPNEAEGALSRRMTQLVRAETCADVAREVGLSGFLVLGDSEEAAGGRLRATILADVCEAVIGALHRDAGIGASAAFVRRWWAPRLVEPATDLRDAKTRLQEHVQGRGLPTPTYTTVERRGLDHAPEFVMRVDVGAIGSAEGVGTNKRQAEQAAAEAMLAAMARAAAARKEKPRARGV